MSDYCTMKEEIKFLLIIHARFIPQIKIWSEHNPKNITIIANQKEWNKTYNSIKESIEEEIKAKIIAFDWSLIVKGYVKEMNIHIGPQAIYDIIKDYLYPYDSTPYVLWRCTGYASHVYPHYQYHPYQTNTPVTSDDDNNENDNQ